MKPRFSLKALLVLVTLVAIALAFVLWQKRIVDTRKGLLSFILANSGGYMAAPDVANNTANFEGSGIIEIGAGGFNDDIAFGLQSNSDDPGPLRRWLGDTAIRVIWLPSDRPTGDLEEPIAVVFPEAQVRHHGITPGAQRLSGKGVFRLPLRPAPLTPQN